MNMKINIILLILIVLAFESKSQNYIVVGKYKSGDYYHRYTPDTIVIYIPEESYIASFYSFDINNDGVKDFKFELHSPATAMGFQYYYCKISALNNNNVVLGYYDSCFFYSGDYRNKYQIAHAFNFNDTINANAIWTSEVYLIYDDYSITSYSCYGIYSVDTAYIGVRVLVDSLYEYGWIKIAGLRIQPWYPTTLSIGGLACNINNSGIEQIISKNKPVIIYPNPFSLQATIKTERFLKDATLMVYNSFGQQVNQIKNISGQTITLHRENLPSGIYFLRLIQDNKTFLTNKLVITDN
jgi:hypothetical protein